MEKRYRIDSINKNYFVETKYSPEGLTCIKEFQKSQCGLFKYQRIQEVTQAYPRKIPLNTLLQRE